MTKMLGGGNQTPYKFIGDRKIVLGRYFNQESFNPSGYKEAYFLYTK